MDYLFWGNAGGMGRNGSVPAGAGLPFKKGKLLRHRIIPAGEEGIAPQDPFDSKKPAPQHAETADRLKRVRGAGWIKPAVGRRIWTDTSLIKPDQGKTKALERILHALVPSSFRTASACCGSIMEPSCERITARTSCIFTSPVAPRATNTMSYP